MIHDFSLEQWDYANPLLQSVRLILQRSVNICAFIDDALKDLRQETTYAKSPCSTGATRFISFGSSSNQEKKKRNAKLSCFRCFSDALVSGLLHWRNEPCCK